MSLLARFEASVALDPDAPAVEQGGVVWSRRQLREAVWALAGELRRAGVGPGSVVGLGDGRDTGHLVGLLAAWWVGAAVCPLDPSLPETRRIALAGDAGVSIVVGTAVAGLPAVEGRLGRGPPSSPVPPVSPDPGSVAWVVHTSGSTGRPKGVVVTHAGVPALLAAQVRAFGLTSADRFGWVLSAGFDASMSDLGTCLWSGATLVVLERPSVQTVVAQLGRLRITVSDLPPAWVARLDPSALPACVRVVVMGGEPCPIAAARAWAARVRLVNVYGPTEATVCVSLGVVDPERWTEPELGQPLPGVSFSVRDPQGERAAEGELWLAGRCLATGYVGQPEETARRFVQREGRRWYRTGDRVRRDGDRTVFLGRTDRERSLAGRRVSPEEVEAALLADPGVLEAAVDVRDGRLVAWVVGTLPTDLGARLPSWLVPAHIEQVDALPRTPSLKVDLGRLTLAAAEAAVDPVLATWRAVTGRPTLGVDDALELDSLTRLDVLARLELLGLPASAPRIASATTVSAAVGRGSAAWPTGPMVVRVAGMARRITGPRLGGMGARRVLLTGATGFLGVHLLARLLEAGLDVVCLVRGSGDRVEAAADRWSVSLPARWTCCSGDLLEPGLGLSSGVWGELARSVDTIVHGAGVVDLLAPLQALWPIHVEATAELMRLQAEGCTTTLHHVSTLSVAVARAEPEVWFRASHGLRAGVIHGGYGASKWAAERLVRAVDGRSGPAVVWRLGLLTGSTGAGRAPISDLLTRVIRALAATGVAPDVGGLAVDVTPVDAAAAVIAAGALRPASAGTARRHVANPPGVPAEALVAAVGRAVPMARGSVQAFRQACLTTPDGGLLQLALARRDGLQQVVHRPFDLFQASDTWLDTASARGSHGLGWPVQPVTPALLDRYVASALRSGP